MTGSTKSVIISNYDKMERLYLVKAQPNTPVEMSNDGKWIAFNNHKDGNVIVYGETLTNFRGNIPKSQSTSISLPDMHFLAIGNHSSFGVKVYYWKQPAIGPGSWAESPIELKLIKDIKSIFVKLSSLIAFVGKTLVVTQFSDKESVTKTFMANEAFAWTQFGKDITVTAPTSSIIQQQSVNSISNDGKKLAISHQHTILYQLVSQDWIPIQIF